MREYARISGMLKENVGPLMSVGETDGTEKAESFHAGFGPVFTSKIFCMYQHSSGRRGLQGVGEQQVRDCFEKLNDFKTLDRIRFT